MNNSILKSIETSKIWEKGFDDIDDLIDNGVLKSNMLPIEGKMFVSLIRTSNMIEETLSKKLLKIGLTLSQVNILEMLHFSKIEFLTQEKISKMVFTSKANISSVLSRMEEKKLINRISNSKNRRENRVKITPLGKEKMLEFFLIGDKIKSNFELLDEKRALKLVEILSVLRKNIKQCPNKS